MNREELLKLRDDSESAIEEVKKLHPLPERLMIPIRDKAGKTVGIVEYDPLNDRAVVSDGTSKAVFLGDCLVSLREALNKLID